MIDMMLRSKDILISISRLKENKIFKAAIIKAIPIMCSYFFVSMAYGSILSYHSCHCIVDEQQAVVLFGNICRGF